MSTETNSLNMTENVAKAPRIESGAAKVVAKETRADKEVNTTKRLNRDEILSAAVSKRVEDDTPDVSKLDKMVAKLNEHAEREKRNIHFAVDEESGAQVIIVTDAETDKVIRTFPPDEVLNQRDRLEEFLTDNGFRLYDGNV